MSNGNTMGGERPRNENDAYYTPAALALACARRVRNTFGDFAAIVEPSAGAGAFVVAAREMWPKAEIVAVEPATVTPGDMRFAADSVADAWLTATWESFHYDLSGERTLIIGNPPFLLAESHIRLALARVDSGSVLVLLLRASILASKDRVAGLWRQLPPSHVWNIAPRPSFTADGKTDGAEYAVVAWVKGKTGDYAGSWLEWERK